MNSSLLREFKSVFGNQITTDSKYQANNEDLKKIFDILDAHVFNNKFQNEDIELRLIDINDLPNADWKGKFGIGSKEFQSKLVIFIIKYATDRFSHIVSVLCHEMIHLYDFKKGPLKNIYVKYGDMKVDKIEGKEFVHGYDVHGTYFKSFSQKVSKLGLIVKDKYDLNSKNLMKKLKEKKNKTLADIFFGKNQISEKDEINNANLKKKLRGFSNSLENTNVEFEYRNEGNWLIAFD